MLYIGNGGEPHFQEAAGSHFQPSCWKWKKPKETGHFQISKAISMDMKASQTADVVNSCITKTGSR
jgi:hypothetical protein